MVLQSGANSWSFDTGIDNAPCSGPNKYFELRKYEVLQWDDSEPIRTGKCLGSKSMFRLNIRIFFTGSHWVSFVNEILKMYTFLQ